jgi:hypothetical protein
LCARTALYDRVKRRRDGGDKCNRGNAKLGTSHAILPVSAVARLAAPQWQQRRAARFSSRQIVAGKRVGRAFRDGDPFLQV